MLSDEHISYVIKDLYYRGIIAEEIRDELIDHVCSSVEDRMQSGERFIDAYTIVLRSFGSTGGLRKTQQNVIKNENKNFSAMLHNYLVTGFRSLNKHRFYSIVNVMGLAVGIASCLLIALYVADELRYDAWNPNADRVYRVDAEVKFGGNEFKMVYRPAPEASILQQDFPGIEATVRLRIMGSYLVRADNAKENIKEKNVVWTDSTFFHVFPAHILEGNPGKTLTEPGGIAISRSIAAKYFPGQSAIGKSIILDNQYHATVATVFEDFPAASHFHFDILIPMVGEWPIAQEAQQTAFINETFTEYLLLQKGSRKEDLEAAFPRFIEKHMGPELASALGGNFTMEKFTNSGGKYELSLINLLDIHLHSDIRGELEPGGNITYVYLFSAIGLLILVVACINFMNLSTARSVNRAKEVGIRKVMGSLRQHLIRQFLTESAIVTSIGFLLAILLAWIALPAFNNLSQKTIEIPVAQPWFYLTLIVICAFIGILAGLYPAFFLSAFKPVDVLRGKGSASNGSRVVRSSLVVFQFMISIFLIIAAITVNRQLSFIQSTKLGFDKEQVIIVHDAYALRPGKASTFRDEVAKDPVIVDGTASGFVPVDGQDYYRGTTSYWKQGQAPAADNLVSVQQWLVDDHYVPTFQMKLTEGRNFSSQFPSDSTGVILNEAAARQFGFQNDAVGKQIVTFENDKPLDGTHLVVYTIVGVLENFHFSSMKQSIRPVVLLLQKSDGNISFRFKSNDSGKVVTAVENVWKRLAPGQPFNYSFLENDFASIYTGESRLGEIFIIFSGLAILIACLGLFALTAFIAEQRTKEIGIRKVLGASIDGLVLLLSRDFGKLILIAFLITAPVAWVAVEWWLKSYQYKTTIGIGVYLLAGGISMAIAFATMSYQSIKAAAGDPVKALRSE